MAIQLVFHTKFLPGANGGTSSGINTTGSNLLVVTVSSAIAASGITLTDSNNNVWTKLTPGINSAGCLFYALTPVVSSGHTFTVLGNAAYPVCCVLGFSGVGLFDKSNPASESSGATSLQLPVTSPAGSGELFVTYVSQISGSESATAVDSGFTISDSANYTTGVSYSGAAAYLIQGGGGGLAPTWSWSGASNAGAVIALFSPASITFNPLTRVSGNVIGLLPNLPIVKNVVGTVKFQLVPPVRSNGAPTQSGDDELSLPVQLIYDVPLNSDGSFSQLIRSNLGITPAGSYYKVTFMIPGYAAADQFYTITGTTMNLNTSQQTVPTGVS